MVVFDSSNITVIAKLTKAEARAYILFLESEKRRHQEDMEFITRRVNEVKKRFGWQ